MFSFMTHPELHALAHEVPSRSAVLEGIEKAANLKEVFELANKALHCYRQAWGDEFNQSEAAVGVWNASAFTVDARDVVKVKNRSVNGMDVIEHIARSDLLSHSLLCAKILAKALLSPFATQEGTQGKFIPEMDLKNYNRFKNCDFSQARQLAKNQLGSVKISLHKSARAQEVAGDEDVWAVHTDCILLFGNDVNSLLASDQLVGDRKYQQWTELASAFDAWQVHADPASGAEEEVFKGLVDRSGFFAVSIGPWRGWMSGVEYAKKTLGQCDVLAKAIDMPGCPVAGLGGIALLLNQVHNKGGSFNDPFRTLSLCVNEFSMGHEWAHALESFTKCSKSESMRQACGFLKRYIRNIPASEQAYELTLKAAQASVESSKRVDDSFAANMMSIFDRFLIEKGRSIYSDAHEREKGVFGLHERMQGLDYSDQPGAMSRAQEVFNVCLKAGAEPINVPSMTWVVESYASQPRNQKKCDPAIFFEEQKQQGANAFLAAAHYLDLAHPSPTGSGYWASGSEMIARCSEAYFVDQGYAGKIVRIDDDWGVPARPQGAERAECSKVFSLWLDCARPVLAKALQRNAEQGEWALADWEEKSRKSQEVLKSMESQFQDSSLDALDLREEMFAKLEAQVAVLEDRRKNQMRKLATIHAQRMSLAQSAGVGQLSLPGSTATPVAKSPKP